MQFRPHVSFEQYRAACELLVAAKGPQPTSRTWQSVVWITAFSSVFGIYTRVIGFWVAFSAWAGLVALALVSKPLAKRSRSKCYKRIYDEEQAILNDQLLTISDVGVQCVQGGGKAVCSYTWQAFIKCIETPEMFLFLPTPNSFVRVSKETFTSIEIEQIAVWSSSVSTARGCDGHASSVSDDDGPAKPDAAA